MLIECSVPQVLPGTVCASLLQVVPEHCQSDKNLTRVSWLRWWIKRLTKHMQKHEVQLWFGTAVIPRWQKIYITEYFTVCVLTGGSWTAGVGPKCRTGADQWCTHKNKIQISQDSETDRWVTEFKEAGTRFEDTGMKQRRKRIGPESGRCGNELIWVQFKFELILAPNNR